MFAAGNHAATHSDAAPSGCRSGYCRRVRGTLFPTAAPWDAPYGCQAGLGGECCAVQSCHWPLPAADSWGCRGCGPLWLNVGANGDVDGPRPNAGPRRSLKRRAMLDIRPVDSLCGWRADTSEAC